jgi:hypothetical protein
MIDRDATFQSGKKLLPGQASSKNRNKTAANLTVAA